LKYTEISSITKVRNTGRDIMLDYMSIKETGEKWDIVSRMVTLHGVA
jgi:hypothetical protein